MLVDVIVTTGNGLTTTLIALEEELHPFAFVPTTEYEPEAFTVIEAVVAPLLHK